MVGRRTDGPNLRSREVKLSIDSDLSRFYKLYFVCYGRSSCNDFYLCVKLVVAKINPTTSSYHVYYMITDLCRDWHQFSAPLLIFSERSHRFLRKE